MTDAPPDDAAAPASAELVRGFPRDCELRWDAEGFAVGPVSRARAAERSARAPERCRTYLDCGAWMGNGDDGNVQRTFGVVCGRTVVLCEFQNVAPVAEVPGPPDEAGPINRVLRALAGPQLLDVTVVRTLRSPVPADASSDAERPRRVHVFLPDLRLPLVPTMPSLPAGLVPDPTQAGCFCHGPLMQRILYGALGASEYRAVGCAVSRDPNEWFYMMADRYRPIAEDVIKFLARLARHRAAAPVHLVQLGGLFEVWAGFSLVFHARGHAGLVQPNVLGAVGLDGFAREWRALAIDTPNREAVGRFLQFPAGARTVLTDHYESEPGAQPGAGVVEQRALAVSGVLYAEHRPPIRTTEHDRGPLGIMALLEQQSRFLPWSRSFEPGWREAFLAYAAEAPGADVPVYVTAYTQVPCLTNVYY